LQLRVMPPASGSIPGRSVGFRLRIELRNREQVRLMADTAEQRKPLQEQPVCRARPKPSAGISSGFFEAAAPHPADPLSVAARGTTRMFRLDVAVEHLCCRSTRAAAARRGRSPLDVMRQPCRDCRRQTDSLVAAARSTSCCGMHEKRVCTLSACRRGSPCRRWSSSENPIAR